MNNTTIVSNINNTTIVSNINNGSEKLFSLIIMTFSFSSPLILGIIIFVSIYCHINKKHRIAIKIQPVTLEKKTHRQISV